MQKMRKYRHFPCRDGAESIDFLYILSKNGRFFFSFLMLLGGRLSQPWLKKKIDFFFNLSHIYLYLPLREYYLTMILAAI